MNGRHGPYLLATQGSDMPTEPVLSRRRAAIALIFAFSTTSSFAQSSDDQPAPRRRGPPIERIANDLGISAERVRSAFQQIGRPPRSTDGPPSQEQMAHYTQALASAMEVPVEKLRLVLDKYRPAPRAPQQQQ